MVNLKKRKPKKVKQVKCPICKRSYKDIDDIEFIEDTGRCFSCDHMEGQIIDDVRIELNREEIGND